MPIFLIAAGYALLAALSDSAGCCMPPAWDDNFSDAIESARPLPGSAMISDFPIVFEQTTLAELTERFGGEVSISGQTSERFRWICYTVNGGRAWIGSSAAMGGPDQQITRIQLLAGDFSAEPGCPEIDAALAGIEGISLGMPRINLTTRFGQQPDDELETMRYYHESSSEIPGCSISGFARIELSGGLVSALSIARITNC